MGLFDPSVKSLSLFVLVCPTLYSSFVATSGGCTTLCMSHTNPRSIFQISHRKSCSLFSSKLLPRFVPVTYSQYVPSTSCTSVRQVCINTLYHTLFLTQLLYEFHSVYTVGQAHSIPITFTKEVIQTLTLSVEFEHRRSLRSLEVRAQAAWAGFRSPVLLFRISICSRGSISLLTL
jgi:hypothetical protein